MIIELKLKQDNKIFLTAKEPREWILWGSSSFDFYLVADKDNISISPELFSDIYSIYIDEIYNGDVLSKTLFFVPTEEGAWALTSLK